MTSSSQGIWSPSKPGRFIVVTHLDTENSEAVTDRQMWAPTRHTPPKVSNFTKDAKPIAGGRTDSPQNSYLHDEKRMVSLRKLSPWKGDPDILRQLLRRDVLKLYTKGFAWAASHHELIPTLVAVAQGRFGIGADLLQTQFPDWYLYDDQLKLARRDRPFPDELEDFLHWSIDQLDDERIIKGLVALLGLGNAGGSTISDRRNNAAPYLEAQDSAALRQSGKELKLLSRLVHVMWVAALNIGLIALPPPT